MLSQEENYIWDKLSEAAKATILGNYKTIHKPYNLGNVHYVTLGYTIKACSHQIDFGDTPN